MSRATKTQNARSGAWTLRLGAGALGLWLAAGLFYVPADQQAVVTRFGVAQSRVALPGLHWHPSFPIGRIDKLRVQETKRLTIGFAEPERALGRESEGNELLTGDRNLISVRMIVQYAVADPVWYLNSLRDVESVLDSDARSELTQVVTSTAVDELLTTGKVEAQQRIHERLQRRYDSHRCGVTVLSINLESITPPSEVRQAFNDVASAREDRDRLVREAESYANELLPVARGDSERLRREASAERSRLIERAAGRAERYAALEREYRKLPGETRTRLYLETMQKVLPRLDKTWVDGSEIDLDFVRQHPGSSDPVRPD